MQGQLDALLRARYGSKSESVPAGQLRLFGETEPEEIQQSQLETAEKKQVSHGRKKPSRDLPRTAVLYDVAENDIPCPSCQKPRDVIGQEVSEQYDYNPASIQIIEHVRIKRACKDCAEHVIIGPRPTSVTAKGLAAPSMLAYVATSKFADHLPLNRLEGIFKRDGASISRSTMCDWMAATASCLMPVYERMKKRVLESEVIWTDDTPIKMQDREDVRNMRNARVWVYLGDSKNPFTVYDFTESRRRDGPVNFLGDFKGFIQADAFSGYDGIYASGHVREVACWAHARRKFFDLLSSDSKACNEILAMIQELYAVEKNLAGRSSAERKEARQLQSVPILQRIKKWLDHQTLAALPRATFKKAVFYVLNNWDALNTYLENGNLTIDNNRSERALRGMAVGRKNWLFVGSSAGGRTAAIITSILATCKENGVHPRQYLQDVLMRLAQGETEIDALLPGNWQPTCT